MHIFWKKIVFFEKIPKNSLFEAQGGPKWGVRVVGGPILNFFIETSPILKMCAKFGGVSFITLEITKLSSL